MNRFTGKFQEHYEKKKLKYLNLEVERIGCVSTGKEKNEFFFGFFVGGIKKMDFFIYLNFT